ncbi:MAG: hypothetical protein JSV20_05990 [Candidatus Bathyarchaeota archaeon]|nr:MAG: hypothetical protein JSV20_05990 [Candidatus Bathyarchaeota archaeon]
MLDINIISYGLGSIGCQIAKFILEKEGLKIVGAIDVAKEKIGKNLSSVLELEKQLEISVSGNAEALFSNIGADLVIHATSSRLEEVYHQILGCLKAGLNVISTCEELSFPYSKHPSIASELDRQAKAKGVTILGTGINPGFLMDTLPIMLTSPCKEVKNIKVRRVMFSGNRRDSYQRKIGTSLSQDVFRKMINDEKITGHVGLFESISMIAAALRWKLSNIEVLPPEPIISENEVKTTCMTIKPGQVAGLKSVAYGLKGKEKVITLEFISHANVKRPYDEISIRGVPNIRQKIIGGIHGDIGTIAMAVNAIPKIMNAKPGLVTMIDLPILSATLHDMREHVKWRK